MAKQTFTVGQVLTAAQMTSLQSNDYNQTVNGKTASYTLVATDVGTRISMNSASATTITVNTSLFAAGDQVYVVNTGSGVTTITAGTATVTTSGSLALGQYDSGTLYFTATGSAIFFNETAGATDIPKSLLTTTGDTIYASATSTPARLGIGSTGQVLTVASGIPSWATPASGGGFTLLSTTTLSGSSTTISSISGSYRNLYMYIYGSNNGTNNYRWNIAPNNVTNSVDYSMTRCIGGSATTVGETSTYLQPYSALGSGNTNNAGTFIFYNYASSTNYKPISFSGFFRNGDPANFSFEGGGAFTSNTAISSLVIYSSVGSFTAGTVLLYGEN
jgi:hypothetical protein